MSQNKYHIFWVSLISAWISSKSWKSFLNYKYISASETWTKDMWRDSSFQLRKVEKKAVASKAFLWRQKLCYKNLSPLLWMFNFLKAFGERLLLARSFISRYLLSSLKSFKDFLKKFTKAMLAFPKYKSKFPMCPLIFRSFQLLCCTPQAFLKICVTLAILHFQT